MGNLFRSRERTDRTYGPSGQLLEARGPQGPTRYRYDADGNLIEKREPTGRTWHYAWRVSGVLAQVTRPDGEPVAFAYDAFGRRLQKRFRGTITRWLWDGNVPLHEWRERDPSPLSSAPPVPPGPDDDDEASTIAQRQREALLVARPAQGPPADEAPGSPEPVTWLFEPETFSPLGKIVGDQAFGIVTDHLSTPLAMFDDQGREVWRASIDGYGQLRNLRGERGACPFRWPGQYEDEETGLHYNRFRYYDPETGSYISRDPISVLAGLRAYGYARDVTRESDVLGLVTDPSDTVGIAQHLSQFDKGSSVFVPKNVVDNTIPDFGQLGRPDGLFVTTPAAADAVTSGAHGDADAVKKALGIEPDQWTDPASGKNYPIYRIDIPPGDQFNLRMATGKEGGANSKFIWGGTTSGGQPEAVIDPVPEARLGKATCVAG